MSDELDIYYWDACLFYEYLNKEEVDPLKKQALEDLLKANKERRNRIFTSAITHLEVVPRKLADHQLELDYWRMFDSVHFYDVPIDRSVLLLAREIRDFYYQPPTKEAPFKLMGPGDAIHLATAIIQEADEFHTRDGKRRGGNIPLIGLTDSSPGGKICGQFEIKITSPIAVQNEMNFGPTPPSAPAQGGLPKAAAIDGGAAVTVDEAQPKTVAPSAKKDESREDEAINVEQEKR